MCVCSYHCAQLSHTTQHRAVLIIFRLILQTSTRALMLSIGGEGPEGECVQLGFIVVTQL